MKRTFEEDVGRWYTQEDSLAGRINLFNEILRPDLDQRDPERSCAPKEVDLALHLRVWLAQRMESRGSPGCGLGGVDGVDRLVVECLLGADRLGVLGLDPSIRAIRVV